MTNEIIFPLIFNILKPNKGSMISMDYKYFFYVNNNKTYQEHIHYR